MLTAEERARAAYDALKDVQEAGVGLGGQLEVIEREILRGFEDGFKGGQQEGLEKAMRWIETEDIVIDPDDRYTGRSHRAKAMRDLMEKPDAE